jgi:stage V sporulation protein D (sporulation-specific penicillin-binding protein)
MYAEFGLGKKTGIDLNGEGNGILFSLDKMGNVELATTAFGQGISVTPIQQVGAVSAIVNGVLIVVLQLDGGILPIRVASMYLSA